MVAGGWLLWIDEGHVDIGEEVVALPWVDEGSC